MAKHPSPPASPHRLSPKDNQDIFNNIILPEYQANMHSYTFPRLALVVGQPGAGKTQAKLIVRSGKTVDALPFPIEVDLDALRANHPVAKTIKPEDVLNYIEWTNKDAYLWTRKLLDAARLKSANVLYESTLNRIDTVKEILGEFAADRYALDLHCMAVTSKESVFGILYRFSFDEFLRLGTGRWVNLDYHHAVYDRYPRNAQILQDEQLVGLIAVYDREKRLHYTRLDAGSWTDPRPVSQVIQEIRDKDWSQNKLAKFRKNWEAMSGAMVSKPGFMREVIDWSEPYLEEARLLEKAEKLGVEDDAKAGKVIHVSPHHVFIEIDGKLKQLSHTPISPINVAAGDDWHPRPYPPRASRVAPKI